MPKGNHAKGLQERCNELLAQEKQWRWLQYLECLPNNKRSDVCKTRKTWLKGHSFCLPEKKTKRGGHSQDVWLERPYCRFTFTKLYFDLVVFCVWILVPSGTFEIRVLGPGSYWKPLLRNKFLPLCPVTTPEHTFITTLKSTPPEHRAAIWKSKRTRLGPGKIGWYLFIWEAVLNPP